MNILVASDDLMGFRGPPLLPSRLASLLFSSAVDRTQCSTNSPGWFKTESVRLCTGCERLDDVHA